MSTRYLLLFLLVATQLTAVGQSTKHDQLEAFFQKQVAEKDFNGNVLIAEKGEVIFEASYGYADINTQEPLTRESVFELASVSKQFTAAGIFMLIKEGKIKPTDDIVKYLPELERYQGITIDQLVHHQGGLPDYMRLMVKHWDQEKIATNDDVIRLFVEQKPKADFKPGKRYAYSNTGYALLASIIERASGMSYKDYLTEKIFKPLEMDHTTVHRIFYDGGELENRSSGHLRSRSQDAVVTVKDYSDDQFFRFLDGLVGDGMVNSTVDDLLKWDRGLYTDQLFTAADREKLFAAGVLASGEKTKYAYGWNVRTMDDGAKRMGHSGSWAGYITYIERHITTDKTIIILKNSSVGSLPNLKHIRHILYGTLVELTPEQTEKYTGTFREKPKAKDAVEIVAKGNQLYYRNDGVDMELAPDTENVFDLVGFRPSVRFTFNLKPDGTPASLRVEQPAKKKDETYFLQPEQ